MPDDSRAKPTGSSASWNLPPLDWKNGEASAQDLISDLGYILDHHPGFVGVGRVPIRLVCHHQLVGVPEKFRVIGLAIVMGADSYIELEIEED